MRPYLQSKLPAPLRKLRPGRSSREETLKLLGPPARADGEALLYKLSTFEYDTVLDFRGKILRSIEFRFVPKQLTLAQIRADGVKVADGTKEAAKDPHEWGRARLIELPQQRLVVRHRMDEERSLESVVFE